MTPPLLKACSICGDLSDQARCTEHRPKDQRPTATKRGYDSTWIRLSRRARRLSPFCEDCGATEDLTTDHSPEAWRRRAAGLTIRLEDVAVVCRGCNTKRGRARPQGMTPPRPTENLPVSQSLRLIPLGGTRARAP